MNQQYEEGRFRYSVAGEISQQYHWIFFIIIIILFYPSVVHLVVFEELFNIPCKGYICYMDFLIYFILF